MIESHDFTCYIIYLCCIIVTREIAFGVVAMASSGFRMIRCNKEIPEPHHAASVTQLVIYKRFFFFLNQQIRMMNDEQHVTKLKMFDEANHLQLPKFVEDRLIGHNFLIPMYGCNFACHDVSLCSSATKKPQNQHTKTEWKCSIQIAVIRKKHSLR